MPRKIPYKPCTNCNASWPATDSYYSKDAESIDGLKHQCKECEQEEERYQYNEQVQERINALDGASIRVLEGLKDLPKSKSVPHLATVFQDLVDVWGGANGFAQRCMIEYLAAKPGSMIRQRYNLLIAKLALETSKAGYVQPPLETLSDEELEKLYQERQEELKLKLIGNDGQSLSDAG